MRRCGQSLITCRVSRVQRHRRGEAHRYNALPFNAANLGSTNTDKLTRRALLRALAGGALSTVGTVILARTSLAALSTPEDTNPVALAAA